MSRQPVVLGTLALVAALAPAHAGTVYIPLTPQKTVGTITYRTEIVAANTGATASPLTTAFLPAGSDGTRANGTPSQFNLLPHATFVLTHMVPAGREGLLAVSGDTAAVTARIVATASSGKILGSIPLPAVGSGQTIPAGDTAQLQGISRPAAGTVLRFGVINLGTEAAACTAAAFRANGAAAGSAVPFTAPALSQQAFPAPLSAFGGALFSDARVEVTCDQPFYPYALQLGPAAGQASVHTPSLLLGGDAAFATTAERPRGDGDDGLGGGGGDGRGGGSGSGGGGTGSGGSGPVAGQDALSYSGLFLNAKANDSTRTFTLPLRSGVNYRKITVDFDLYLNQWQTPLFHAVTSLRRNDRTLYYGLILRGDRAKTLIDLGHEQTAKGDGPWKERTQYHLRLEADAGSRTVTLRVFQGNAVVHTLTGPLVSTDLSVTAGKAISVDFGIGRVADGAYFPPIGWQYSNLNVKAEPF
ncbi:MAG TPA: hypothetical protein VGK45_16295 [Thermoanaerobaculia bacterium]